MRQGFLPTSCPATVSICLNLAGLRRAVYTCIYIWNSGTNEMHMRLHDGNYHSPSGRVELIGCATETLDHMTATGFAAPPDSSPPRCHRTPFWAFKVWLPSADQGCWQLHGVCVCDVHGFVKWGKGQETENDPWLCPKEPWEAWHPRSCRLIVRGRESEPWGLLWAAQGEGRGKTSRGCQSRAHTHSPGDLSVFCWPKPIWYGQYMQVPHREEGWHSKPRWGGHRTTQRPPVPPSPKVCAEFIFCFGKLNRNGPIGTVRYFWVFAHDPVLEKRLEDYLQV